MALKDKYARFSPLLRRAKKFLRTESGATAIEYGIILSAIVVTIVGTIKVLGTKVNGLYTTAASMFP
jgi:pilus assembly protein Flp/PilA